MKFLKNNEFAIFDLNEAKIWAKRSSYVATLAIFALNFHSGVCTTTTSCFKIYSPLIKAIDSASFFLLFFQIQELI